MMAGRKFFIECLFIERDFEKIKKPSGLGRDGAKVKD
jgi:hypothetical protein